MTRKKKSFIFTDMDLDGAMCYLLFTWFRNAHIPYIATRVNDFGGSFKGWLRHHNPKDYDYIYILDLDISGHMDLVDLDNVVIIDHHDSHVRNKHKYKNAKVFVDEVTSCARHVYNLLHKKSVTELTDAHKHLMLLVDDYDCYKLQLQGSHDLNTLFWNYQGDKLSKFVKTFKDGYTGFTDEQKSIIQFYKNKTQHVLDNISVFEAHIPINGKTYKFVSSFANSCINDVAHHIITEYKADVGLVMNPDSNKVSFRKDKKTKLDLSKLAQKLTTNGGGHSYASGGIMGDATLSFSKLFTPVK